MTEEYVSAMVTVIPVVMVVATVEFQALIQRNAGILPDEDVDAPPRRHTKTLGELLLLLFWAALISSHVVAELYLIEWLVGTERPPNEQLAELTALIGIVGFIAVSAFTMALLMGRQMRVLAFEIRSIWYLWQTRGQHAPTGRPPQRPSLPRHMPRPRPANPAHRAMRGARHPRRRTTNRITNTR
ncbi:hypothetical protein ACWKT3_41200 [Streptomyces violaceus]